jgi:hypothetical protein
MAAATTLLLLSGLGCRQDMHDEPKFFPQRGTDFYADGRSARPQVADTIARNQLHADTYFYSGFINGKEGDGMPFPVTMKVLERGQERFNIYCTPCHSRVGNGMGMIVDRGYAHVPDYHTPRLEAAPLGHCGIYQGAAVEPEGDPGRRSRGNPCSADLEHCRK